jgi:hypothetical protein
MTGERARTPTRDRATDTKGQSRTALVSIAGPNPRYGRL